MVGITNTTNASIDFLNNMVNVSTMPEMFVNINHDIYGGWLYFILLLVFWVILYFGSQELSDQPLNNIMYTGAVISIIVFLMRIISFVQEGVLNGLISDAQMWFFPVVTLLVALIIWVTKD